MTAVDRFGPASPAIDVNDVLFRMLEPHEIGAAMAFLPGYQVIGSKREKVRQYGNAVTPPVAEVIIARWSKRSPAATSATRASQAEPGRAVGRDRAARPAHM